MSCRASAFLFCGGSLTQDNPVRENFSFTGLTEFIRKLGGRLRWKTSCAGSQGLLIWLGERPAPEGVVQRMARALIHRGPDEEGFS